MKPASEESEGFNIVRKETRLLTHPTPAFLKQTFFFFFYKNEAKLLLPSLSCFIQNHPCF